MSLPTLERGRLALLAAAAVLLLLAPEFTDISLLRTLMLTVVLGLVASGLNFLMGYAGQLALGHVFFYGAAAYATAILATRVTTDALPLLAAGIAASVFCAVITGIPGLRLSSWTLGLVSFFLIAILPDVVEFRPDLTGGPTGVVGVPRLQLGGELNDANLFRFSAVLLLVWLAFQRNVIYSAYGRLFAVLRSDPIQVESLGVSAYRLKLFAYVVSAVPAGAAGTAFATLDGFVSPASFTVTTAILMLAAMMLGGQRTLYGPLLGTLVLVEVQQRMLSLQQYTLLAFGVFLVVISIMLPAGLVGTVAKRLPRLRRPYLLVSGGAERAGSVSLGPEQQQDLVVENVSKRFGGNQALDGVSLTAGAGQITALIGPNGSGKTTMLNVISGFVRSDGGTTRLGSQRLESRSPHQVAAVGVGRTFQTPSIPDDLTVAEAISVAAFRTRKAKLVATALRLPSWRRDERRIAARVDEVLRELDLEESFDTQASALPLGKKRLLEIARGVMMRPPLLVLDEAASGLDPHETERLGRLLRRLAHEGTAVLLVEHDMDLVLGNADQVYVLASGAVLASGPPAEVSRDEDVLKVYLGESTPVDEAVVE